MAITIITATEDHCVVKCDATVGESPLWHSVEKRLYWVDIQGKKIFRFDPATHLNETFKLPDIVTCLAFRAAGGLIVTLRKQLAFFDPSTKKLEKMRTIEADQPHNRFNDGRVDPQGRFWAGTMGDKNWNSPVGHLYRVMPDLQVDTVRGNIICANGTAWSPDGKTMYFTESFRSTIWAYDFDSATGDISNGRRFVALDPSAKIFPDGLCVDSEGFVWSNHVPAGKVVRYDPSGKAEREIHFPIPRAVGSAFGGDELSTLYVTSATETMTAKQLKEFPLSGSLFAIDVGIRGLPATSFAG